MAEHSGILTLIVVLISKNFKRFQTKYQKGLQAVIVWLPSFSAYIWSIQLERNFMLLGSMEILRHKVSS